MANMLTAFAEAAIFVLHTFIEQHRDTYSITKMKRAIRKKIYISPPNKLQLMQKTCLNSTSQRILTQDCNNMHSGESSTFHMNTKLVVLTSKHPTSLKKYSTLIILVYMKISACKL